MSNSRTKRQFAGAASDPAQRSITSFFKTTSTHDDSQSDSIAVTSSSQTAPLNGPVLPPTIRSSLLNVGMRVRKSVPEGYKTGKITSGFPSWMEDSSSSNNTTPGSNIGVGHNRPVSAAPPPLPTVNRELTPFCGIHKIGGYAVQDEGVNSRDYSSQDSNASSTISNAGAAAPSSLHFAMQDTNRKRIHEDGSSEEEGCAGLFGEDMDWRCREQFPEDRQYEEEENRAPRSLEPMAWCGGGNKTNTIANDNRRVMAVPKRRGSQFTQTTITSFGGYVSQSSGIVPADDFEEAPFLDYSGLSHRGGRSVDMDMD